MKRDTRNALITVAAVFTVFAAAYGCLILYTGSSSPFYTVESGSMMHSDRSKIGIIDTGDMIIARDPSKVNIITYAEGLETGYVKFGDPGDVIIYTSTDGRTVIHRAMMYLEYMGDGKWTVRGMGAGYENISGTQTVAGIVVDLDSLKKVSGYITKGDNNSATDQSSGISDIVEDRMVVGVASNEIPWLGCIKLYLTGKNTDQIPSNSVWYLITTMVVIITAVGIVNYIYERRKHRGT